LGKFLRSDIVGNIFVVLLRDPPDIDWDRVDRLVQSPPGVPVPITVGAPGLAEMIAALPVYHTPASAPEQVAIVEQQSAPLDSPAQPKTEQAPQSTPEIEPKPTATADIESKPETAAVDSAEAQAGTDTLALSPPTAEPKSEAVVVDGQQTTPAPEEAHARWYVQVGSFKNPKNAEKLATKNRTDLGLKTSGKSFSPSGLHRVLAGPFQSRGEAEQHAALIESSLGGNTLVVALDAL